MGTWSLSRRLPNEIDYAASGPVNGTLMGQEVSLALEVDGVADAGYLLTGTIDRDEIRGEWTVEYGPIGAGAPFEARR